MSYIHLNLIKFTKSTVVSCYEISASPPDISQNVELVIIKVSLLCKVKQFVHWHLDDQVQV